MNCVLAGSHVPIASLRNSIPLRFRAVVLDCCQAAATPERRIAYRRDASVYRYHTVFATQNQCFACGFDNTIPLAVLFSIAYSNFYACQAAATIERRIAYICDAVGDCYVF